MPLLPDIGFQLLKGVVDFDIYLCNDAQNFSIDERSGLQAGQFSTRTLLL